jgi:hypothetical protein
MESPDADRKAGGEERPGEINGAGKLVRLHADQANQRFAPLFADELDDPIWANPPVGLVISIQTDFDGWPEYLPPTSILRQAVQAGECIGGNGRPEPLDGVAIVIVMRGLDHYEMEKCERVSRNPIRRHATSPDSESHSTHTGLDDQFGLCVFPGTSQLL